MGNDNNYWDNDEDNQGNQSGKALREQLEATLKKLAAAEARAEKAEKVSAEKAASEVLTSKGYPAGIARLASKDGVDIADSKALEQWLEDNKDLLPAPVSADTEQVTEQTNQEQPNPAAEAAKASQARVAGLHSQATPETTNKFELAMKSLTDDATPEQVRAAIMASGL